MTDGNPCATLVRTGLRTPRAAAFAGIIFSLLLAISLLLLRLSVPADPHDVGEWLATERPRVSLALNLVPFAGVAFLWFLGVLRDRLGAREDRFFATVFLGSGLMFLGMLFVAAASVDGLILAYAGAPATAARSGVFAFGRAFAYDIMHIYAFKMAAVFMVTASTLLLFTQAAARWVAILGYAAALTLLVASGFSDWSLFLFPAWVLLVSTYILIDNRRRQPRRAVAAQHT
ncbi:MAG: hypothetical protein ACREFO_12215 [Acetobacteraceae bacterium]